MTGKVARRLLSTEATVPPGCFLEPANGTFNARWQMRPIKSVTALIAFVAVGACGSGEANDKPDLSFLDELELAVSAAEDSQAISAVELGAVSATDFVEEAPAPASRPAPSPTPRPATRTVSNTSSGTYSNPAPRARVETVKHTKRDAAIGAGAGAVIGAVAGGRRNRVEGAVVGAVIGGVLGGVIGNNVDKSTRVVYEY